MTPSFFPPPDDSLFQPSDCLKHGVALRDAIDRLQESGIRVPQFGRLSQEANILKSVGESGEFPSDIGKRAAIAHALADASDFYDIISFLPRVRSTQVAAEIAATMGGVPHESRRRRASYRFQSQYWLASILSRGGYQPTIPLGGAGRNPDYLIEEGLSRYAVEIKRPENAESARRLLLEGAKQIRDFGCPGCIILDLSECLSLAALACVDSADAVAARDALLAQSSALFVELRGMILDDENHLLNRGFERVVAMLTIARGWSWLNGETRSGYAIFATAGASAFLNPVKNVRYHHTVDILERIITGLRAAGFEFEPFRDVATPLVSLPFSWRL